MNYDPKHPLGSDVWLALDESERIEAVIRYHRQKKVRLPNERIHAAIHVIVENQWALGDSFPVEAVLKRLMKEGLDRHEAIHAIGSILSEQLFTVLKKKTGSDLNERYLERLSTLTAESWRRQEL